MTHIDGSKVENTAALAGMISQRPGKASQFQVIRLGPDLSTVLRSLEKSGGDKSSQALFLLGQIYQGGFGLNQDDAKARLWFTKAADRGFADAQSALGVFHATGRGGLDKSDQEAVRLYKLSADQGNAHAQSNLTRLTSGTGKR